MGSVATLLEQIGYSNVDVVGKAFFGVMICVATVKVTCLFYKTLIFVYSTNKLRAFTWGCCSDGELSEDSQCTSRRVLHSSYSFCCRQHRQQRREDHLSRVASGTTVQVFSLTKPRQQALPKQQRATGRMC